MSFPASPGPENFISQSYEGPPSPDINGGLDEDQRQPFRTLSKVQPKAICGKQVIARTSKRFCADSRASTGQNKGDRRTFQGHKNLKRTQEDNSRTDPGQAEDKKGLTKGSHRRKVQFLPRFLHDESTKKLTCSSICPKNISCIKILRTSLRLCLLSLHQQWL